MCLLQNVKQSGFETTLLLDPVNYVNFWRKPVPVSRKVSKPASSHQWRLIYLTSTNRHAHWGFWKRIFRKKRPISDRSSFWKFSISPSTFPETACRSFIGLERLPQASSFGAFEAPLPWKCSRPRARPIFLTRRSLWSAFDQSKSTKLQQKVQ